MAEDELNKMYVRRLDEIEDFRFDVTHLPGSLNPADPRLRGRARAGCLDGGSRPGESAGAVFSAKARRAVPRGAGCHSGRVGSKPAGGSGLVRRRSGQPLREAQGGGRYSPPCASMFVALAGSELALGTGTTPAPPPPVPSDHHFLAPAFV